MKVLLVSPPSRAVNHYRPPLALMYLSGYLKKNGVDAEIIDITIKGQIRDKTFYDKKDKCLADVENKIISWIRSSNADIIGITCYSPEIDEARRLAKSIKSFSPAMKIIVGGIHPTLYPEDFLKEGSDFEFAVLGEGEVTFLELVNAIREKKSSYSNIKGIGYFDRVSSQGIITQRRDLKKNLDEVSFPDYEGVDMGFYTTPSPYAIRGVFTKSFYILSSRGCPSSCTFCVSKKLRDFHGISGFVRLRSPRSLFSEIKGLKDRYGIDSFYFIDDLFTLRKDYVYEFCSLMIKNKMNLIWACSSKVNTVDYDMLKAMRDAGCVQIDFGVERGSDKALLDLKKGITVNQIRKTFKDCASLGIRTFANLLVNAPGETLRDLEDITDLVQDIKPNIVSFNIFTPYPGCEIFDSCSDKIYERDYPLLMESADDLIRRMPDKFRFAAHSVPFDSWVRNAMRKYNRVLPNVLIYLTKRYWNSFFHSRHKIEYFTQFKFLLREFIAQKF